MKGNAKIIELLNEALRDELMAINQYMLHSEMFSNWGFEKMASFEKGLAREEMGHAEKLVERIIFLEGMPGMTDYGKLNIGTDAPSMVGSDLNLEMGAVEIYNKIIDTAFKNGDKGTVDFIEPILRDEERHVNDQEAEQDMIEKMGVQIYLSTKV
jgi:bacterioferritin